MLRNHWEVLPNGGIKYQIINIPMEKKIKVVTVVKRLKIAKVKKRKKEKKR